MMEIFMKKTFNIQALPWFILFFLCVFPFLGFSPRWLAIGNTVFYYLMLSISWNLMMGFGGLFSFGHTALSAVGGYASALFVIHIGIPPMAGLFFGGLIAAIFSLILGLICLRLRGFYLALVTWAFAEIVMGIVKVQYDFTGGTQGLRTLPLFWEGAGRLPYYYLGLALSFLITYSVYRFSKTDYGIYLRSIREDETAAEVLGVNTVLWKVICFTYAGFWAGVAGCYYGHYIGVVDPSMGSLGEMSIVVLTVVVGGMGTVFGPVLGTFLVIVAADLLRGKLAALSMVCFALLMILVVRFFRGGLMQYFGAKR
jgi:branched-chain amino acid transport system permease protein